MEENFELHGSDTFRTFESGSKRGDDTGKPLMSGLSPYALHRYAIHMRKGADKYGRKNWELGQPISEFIESLERHLNAFKRGLRDEDHGAAILYNIQAVIHFEEMAKLGDQNALNFLDEYASKNLAADLIYEREAMLEAESYMETFEGDNFDAEPIDEIYKVGDRVITNRDITGKMLYGGSSEIRTPAGTLGEIRSDFGDSDDPSLKYNVKFANGDAWNVSSDWFNLAPEPETLVGRTVRVTRDVRKNDYFDDQAMRGGYHLYKDQTLEVVALKDDGLYICKGTKYNPYFKNIVEESGWQFEHVRSEWIEAI